MTENKDMKHTLFKKQDLILITVVLAAAALLFLGTNHLIIKGGEVWVSEATCPDKICVHQGKIHMDGEIIVCLPNKMTAQIKSVK